MLCVVDEFTHECLAIRVKRKLNNADVIETLADIILSRRAVPEFMRSDNGPEFIAKALRKWIGEIGVQTAYIEKGSPWDYRGREIDPVDRFPEGGVCLASRRSIPRIDRFSLLTFNARLRDELLNGEIFYTLQEAQIVVEAWRRHFNAARPHSSLKGRPPAPESITFPPAQGIRPWLAMKEGANQERLAEVPPAH